MIGIAFRDLGGMSLAAFSDAVEAYKGAHEEDTGPVLTDREEEDLAQMMGLDD